MIQSSAEPLSQSKCNGPDNYSQKNKEIIKFQTKNNFIVCFATLLFTQLYSFTKNYDYLDYASKLICVHIIIDIFYTKKIDMLLHHLFVLLFTSFKYLHNTPPEDDWFIVSCLLNTEISSFFFVFKIWMDEFSVQSKGMKVLIYINDLLFFFSFCKFRLYDFYHQIINNSQAYIFAANYSNTLLNILHIYSGVYGLFLLNLYWFMYLLKKFYKVVIVVQIPKLKKDFFINQVLSYIYFLNILSSVYAYSQSNMWHPVFLLDIGGIVCLSFFSYRFHRSKNLFLEKNPEAVIEYTHELIWPHFLNDALFIHIRCFLCLMTHCYLSFTKYGLVVLFSAVFHIIGYNVLVSYTRRLKKNKILFLFDDSPENKNRLLYTHLCICLPVFFDIGSSILVNTSHLNKINISLLTFMLGLTLIIHPFYHASHILFHILLVIHTYHSSLLKLFHP